MKKKFLSMFVIAMCLVLSLSTTAFAATPSSMSPSTELVSDLLNLLKQDLNTISTVDINKFKKQINSLSDNDFDSFIVEYLTTEKDFSKVKNNLSKLGVEVKEPKKGARNAKEFSIQSLEAWQLDLYITVAKRAGDSYYRLIAYYTPSASESRPASYDAVVIYWDKSIGTYYSYSRSSSTYNSLKSSTQKGNGTVVFNSYDTKFSSSTPTQYVAVYVNPAVSSGTLSFAVEYFHSCYTTQFSGSLNPSVSYSGTGGVSGSVGVSINWSSNETVWQISDDNDLYF